MSASLPYQVIYHLNNKNEDFEFEIQELTDRYESDVAALKADSASKLAFVRQQVQEALDDAKVRSVTWRSRRIFLTMFMRRP